MNWDLKIIVNKSQRAHRYHLHEDWQLLLQKHQVSLYHLHLLLDLVSNLNKQQILLIN